MSVFFHLQVVQLGADAVAIKPARLVKRRNIHLLQLVEEIRLRPPVVIHGMFDPPAPVRIIFAEHRLVEVDRQPGAPSSRPTPSEPTFRSLMKGSHTPSEEKPPRQS